MMTSKILGPDDDDATEAPSQSPTVPGIRRARVTASAVTMRELPAAMDTVPLPSLRGAGFRAPEEGGSERPFDTVRASREVNPHARTMPAPSKSSARGKQATKSTGKSAPGSDRRKR